MTYGYYTNEINEARKDAKREYYRARKDAREADRLYRQAAGFRFHARWLTRRSGLWDELGAPADTESLARSVERLADSYARSSDRATAMARFYNDLARRYERMEARRNDTEGRST